MFERLVAAYLALSGVPIERRVPNSIDSRATPAGCAFQLNSTGAISFPVGEDAHGEVLAGSKLSLATFYLNNSTIVDANGLPCWFTPPTYVLTCGAGAKPSTPFTIGADGKLSYNGSSTLYECANGIGDEVNIYSKPNQGAKCGNITLVSPSCRPSASTSSLPTVTVTQNVTVVSTVTVCPAPAPATTTKTTTTTKPATTTTTIKPATTTTTTKAATTTVATSKPATTTTVNKPSTTTTTPAKTTTTTPKPATTTTTVKTSAPTTLKTTTTTASTAPKSTCPLTLPANFQFPHLIIPVNSSQPNATAGTSYFGTITPSVSSLINFDIPVSAAGAKCTLWFSLPTQAELATSSFTLSGPGSLSFASLLRPASASTSYTSAPGVASSFGTVTVAPGNAYSVATFACPAGTTVGYKISSVGGTSLTYFQDYNPCAIGLWIIPS